ncbi:MAG TPA: Rap1a/Tai family immunity protein [Steroidobacteraceae bacterium]|nr:Rap1a/Tai family immunity protein [Steroidobacteraceae bacterium]
MRSLATIVTAIAASLTLTAAAPEQPAMTAGDLAQLCSGSDHVSVNACRIYMLGVTQGIAVGIRMAAAPSPDSRPCVPPGISAEELEAALKKQLASLDADSGQRDAAGFIGAALAARFPCRGGKQ